MGKSIWDILDAVLQPAVDAYGNLRCNDGYTYNSALKRCIPDNSGTGTGGGTGGGSSILLGGGGTGTGGTGTGGTGTGGGYTPPPKKFPVALVAGGVLVLGTVAFFVIKKMKKK